MNLKQMEYFTAIVNEGSISAAAKAPAGPFHTKKTKTACPLSKEQA